MKAKYESLSLIVLKELAKKRGLKVTGMKKNEIVDEMLKEDQRLAKEDAEDKAKEVVEDKAKEVVEGKDKEVAKEVTEELIKYDDVHQQEENIDNGNNIKVPSRPVIATKQEDLDSGEMAHGILEVMQDGYGFIRCENYLPGENDVYVSPSQIRRFRLKTGDVLTGHTRVKTQAEKFGALLYLAKVNNEPPNVAAERKA